MNRTTPETIDVLSSVETVRASHSFNDHFWSILNITQIRMESQMKYCCLARGEEDAYQHMPTDVGYRKKIYGYVVMRLLYVLLY